MAVTSGMAAEAAGIEPGDVILEVDGEGVLSVPDLQRKIRRREPGQIVEVTVVRREDLRRETIEIRLTDAGEMRRGAEPRVAEAGADDPLGIEVENITSDVRRALDLPRGVSGVVIVSADVYGPLARRAGNTRGRIITRIDRRAISSVAEYEEAVSGLEPGDVIGVDLYDPQGRSTLPFTVQIPR
jgi:S1-C subfamily serine protease